MFTNKNLDRFLCATMKNKNYDKWVFVSLLALFWSCAPSVPIPPPVKDTENLPQARLEIHSDGLLVESKTHDIPSIVPVQSRSFTTIEEFVQFAERNLGAEPIRKEGKVIAVKIQFQQFGEVVFRDSTGVSFSQNDFVAAYLGGSEGTLTVGNQEIHFSADPNDTTTSNFTTSCQNCDERGCVKGETWYDEYFSSYKSLGGKATQVEGGYESYSYRCCKNGELVIYEGRPQCRARIPDKWKYDRQVRHLVPVGEPPYYTYHEPDLCSYSVLNNTLVVALTYLRPGIEPENLTPVPGYGVPSVTVGESIIALIQEDISDLWRVNQVCGAFSSSHGGTAYSFVHSWRDYTECPECPED